MSHQSVLKRSSRKPPRQSNAGRNVPRRHEDRVHELGGKLLAALAKGRLPREDENIKGIGWFLVSVGESLERGSLVQARALRKHNGTSSATAKSLSVALCLLGDQVMDWGTGLLHQEKKNESKRTDKPSQKST